MTDEYEDDGPRRITVRHRARCAECGAQIEIGDRAVWQPSRGAEPARTYCDECGEEALDG